MANFDFKNDEQLNMLNHSCAHVLAQAIQHLYPNAKFWVGPVVSEGFYYDIDLGDKVMLSLVCMKAADPGKRLRSRDLKYIQRQRQQNRQILLWSSSTMRSRLLFTKTILSRILRKAIC